MCDGQLLLDEPQSAVSVPSGQKLGTSHSPSLSYWHDPVEAEPEIHRIGSESGSALRLLYEFLVKLLGQLANFGSIL